MNPSDGVWIRPITMKWIILNFSKKNILNSEIRYAKIQTDKSIFKIVLCLFKLFAYQDNIILVVKNNK